jgi:hypothetical protein
MHSQSIEVPMKMVVPNANADFYSNFRVQMDVIIMPLHGSHGASSDADRKKKRS